MEQAVSMRQTGEVICRLHMWNRDGLSTAANSHYECINRPPLLIRTNLTHFCSCPCDSSERSSPDNYASSVASDSNGGGIGARNGHPLRYSSNVHLLDENVNLISTESVAQLDTAMGRCGEIIGDHREELLMVFTNNSDMLSSLFYEYDTPWILGKNTKTSMDFSKCEDLGKDYLIMLKISTKVLQSMFCQFCGQNQPFFQTKKDYFQQFAKSPIKKMLEIALSFSESNWSEEHIRPMLLAYDTLQDVLPTIRELSPDEPDEFFTSILHNMRNASRGIIDNMKRFIQHKVQTWDNIAIHPTTCFLINAIKIFNVHKNLLHSTLVPGDGQDSFGYLINGVIACWKLKIKELSMLDDPDKNDSDGNNPNLFIFLLNNIKHFNRDTNGLLDGLLVHRELIEECKNEFQSDMENYTSRYMTASWGPAISCLNNHTGGSIRQSMNAFISKFEGTFDCQKVLKVPDSELKQKLRDDIENLIFPAYEISFEELQRNSNSGLFCSCFPRNLTCSMYTPEILRRSVQGLFEG
ncbi:hypothetical protein DAI22_04g005600 [Oryza sativa Japonica Group]|nr:hypothetical protein DAI22_04g005600 [Oryza sativa Japonica Group]